MFSSANRGVAKIIIALLVSLTFASAETILIMRSSGDAFKEVANSIAMEVQEQHTVVEEIINSELPAKKIAKIIKTHNPKLVVLMNNKAVKSFKAYQQSLDISDPKIPSLSLMTALLPAEIKGLENAAGISYEVPIVTSVVNLRALLGMEKVRLGVIYREFLKPFIDENATYCKKEGIEMIRGFVPSNKDNYGDLLKRGLEMFVSDKMGANMIWIPNDPVFLKPDIIREVWIPFSEQHSVPIIVGVESMLSTNVNFGTYAVLPDHIALGLQASGLILDIQDNDWKVDFTIVEPPISIYQVLNPKKIQKKYDVGDERIIDVDKVVK